MVKLEFEIELKQENLSMGWMGKLVGGTIGFALGGPLGAIFGAAFGHAFDTGSNLDTTGNRQRLSTVEQHQLTFFCGGFFHAGQAGSGGWAGDEGRD
jgi:hypothetical protein